MDELYVIKGETLSSIADAIREQEGTSGEIAVGDFPERIASIDISTEDYMRMIDLYSVYSGQYFGPISERNYSNSEVEKVETLLDTLGGN